MNRVIVFGVAVFFAVVGIALMGGQQQAVAGHGCNGCHGAVACDGGNVGCAPVACSGDTGRCFGRNRAPVLPGAKAARDVPAVLGAKVAHAAKVANVTLVVAPAVVIAAVRPPIAAVRLSLRIAVASPRKPLLRPRPPPDPARRRASSGCRRGRSRGPVVRPLSAASLVTDRRSSCKLFLPTRSFLPCWYRLVGERTLETGFLRIPGLSFFPEQFAPTTGVRRPWPEPNQLRRTAPVAGRNVRAGISLALFAHLFIVFVCLAANLAPRAGAASAAGFQPYTQLLNFDLDGTRYYLTHATTGTWTTASRSCRIRRNDGDDQWTSLCRGVRGSERYHRYQRLAETMAFFQENDDVTSLLAEAVARYYARQENAPVRELRCRSTCCKRGTRSEPSPTARDPDSSEYFAVLYRASVIGGSRGPFRILKRETPPWKPR